jgi:U3 small nucleolar RNA-associated protein 5
MSTKRKAPAVIATPVVKKSAKTQARTNIDESRAAVFAAGSAATKPQASQAETIDISSDSSSNYDDVSDLDEEETAEDADAKKGSTVNGEQIHTHATPPPEVTRAKPVSNGDVEMDGDASDDEGTSPTFGDLIRGSSTIDVTSSLALQQQSMPLSPLSGPQPRTMIPPASLSSLGTVLNQALRTDDANLLESCLQTSDHDIVTNTIARMDSALAAKLLAKLAARMHSRPGRALGLMKWIQGTLIAHGGALATQGDLVRKLADLNHVLEERSRGLNSLLALKGKLDMLDAQLKVRKMNKTMGAGRQRGRFDDEMDEDGDVVEDAEDEGIIYVEGEEEEVANGKVKGVAASGKKGRGAGYEDDFPLTNGMGSDSDDSSDGEDDEEELEASDEDVDNNEDVDHDDVEEESGEEEDDSEGEAARPPSKVQKVASAFGKRR